MNAIKRFLLTAALAVSALAPAHADLLEWLFPPPQVEGTVGYVQTSHFMIVSKDNKFLRVFLPPGQAMPAVVQPGMFIVATVREAQDQTNSSVVLLERIDAVQGPNGVVPIVSGSK